MAYNTVPSGLIWAPWYQDADVLLVTVMREDGVANGSGVILFMSWERPWPVYAVRRLIVFAVEAITGLIALVRGA